MKPAFMIIDMQKEYFKGTAKLSMIDASEYINEVLSYFRRENLPIIWVQDVEESCGVVPGSEGFEVIDILERKEGEKIIHKKYGNTFNKTECEQYLKENGVDVIIMAGFCAEHCVLSTYRGALDLDLIPILLKNGLASGDKENLAFVEKISHTIPYILLDKIL